MTTSYEELIRELRDFAIRYGGIPRREIEAIISRHSVAKPQEPLAVLACKKNSWIAFAGQTMGGKYRIDIETMNVPLAGDSCFMEEVYAEAEAESKARAYLSSLPDQNKGDK
jgi:hypothetical protein